MPSRRLLAIALAGEGSLALVGVAWIWLRGISVHGGPPAVSSAAGIVVALLLAAGYLGLLRFGPATEPIEAMRRLYHQLFRPLFQDLDLPAILIVSAAAGLGEEILFRGALQQEVGLIPASLAFGAMHVGGRDMVVLGAWAAVTGLVLGAMALATGGLIAPIVAHAGYDAIALAYIRWGQPPGGTPAGPAMPSGRLL